MKKQAVIFSGLVNVDQNLVGTAVIYKKIADILFKQGYHVSIVVPRKSDLKDDFINFYLYDEKSNKKLIDSCDIVIFGAYPPVNPLLYAYEKRKIILTYLWSIAPIGSLEFKDFGNNNKQHQLHEFISASYNLSLLLSDKIFCRDEQIKKLVFGSLISLGRFNLSNYNLNKKLEKLIEVAGFGIDNSSFSKKRGFYRGVLKGINNNSFILNWNGGIWNWNDAETLIKAMYILRNKNIKLVFQGCKNPSGNDNISQEAQKAYNLAKKLKLKNKNIFFVDTWVPHNERSGFLLESDVGLVSSPDIPEANLFFKTRIYDYLWTELPVILNDCEAFASLVKKKSLGLISKTGDAKSWARNIEILSEDAGMIRQIKFNIREYKKDILWSKTLKPLSCFLKNPYNLKDKYDKKNSLILKNIKLNKDIISS